MSEVLPPEPARPATGPATADSERLTAMLCYGLFLLALAYGITMPIGALIAYVRRRHARGTLYQSHYANLITVFWVSLVLSLISLVLMLNGMFAGMVFANRPVWRRLDGSPILGWPGWHMPGLHIFDWSWPMAAAAMPVVLVAWLVFAFWYLWRVIRGFVRALDEKPY